MFQKTLFCVRKKGSIIPSERRMDHAFCDKEFVLVSDFVFFCELDGRGKPARIQKAPAGARG